jgi:hypothetical protein
LNDRTLPERRNVKAALRQAGLSHRQVDAVLRGGWAALVGETEAENAELQEKLREITDALQSRATSARL